MFPLKDESEACRIGLIIKLLNQRDVVRWADKVISSLDHNEDVVLDISLNGLKYSLSEIENRLLEIRGIPNRELITKIILGICSSEYNNKKRSACEISSILYNLFLYSKDLYNTQIYQEILRLTDGCDLAFSGVYGSTEKASSEIKEFLDQYSHYYAQFISE